MNSFRFLTHLLVLICFGNLNAQFKQITFGPSTKTPIPEPISIDLRTGHIVSNNEPNYKDNPINANVLSKDTPHVLATDETGRPIAISYRSQLAGFQLKNNQTEYAVNAYMMDLANVLSLSPSDQFKIVSSKKDDYGIMHFKLQQTYNDIPVYGQQIVLHADDEGIYLMNGSCHSLNEISLETPAIGKDKAAQTIQSKMSKIVRVNEFPSTYLKWLKPHIAEPKLALFLQPNATPRLIWQYIFHANTIKTYEVLMDATTGEVIDYWLTTCQLHNSIQTESVASLHLNPTIKQTKQVEESQIRLLGGGDEVGSGRDLNGKTQQFSVWKQNGRYHLIDATQTMFKPSNSKMPDEPIGSLWTLDGFNTSPTNNNFKIDHVSSNSNSWNALSVSAHSNALKAFKYFQQVHGRNSINGNGGNVVSFIRVSDENGKDMDNAFWNGQAIFYGNGDRAFKQLAGGLDVAGHEMTHGVIQNTANLIYKDEPGAISESMADVFGVMIDRSNWLLAEDIILSRAFPSGAMRSMSDPHNGGRSLSDPGWQPNHVNEQFKGDQDNGGVHINSGIPNYAFYLFVQNMRSNVSEAIAKGKAEKVYYQALKNYLTRSSKFIDLRIAVVSSAQDIYGANSTEVQAAKKAFDQVGIGQSTGGKYQNDLRVNPGNQYFLATDVDYNQLVLFDVQNGGNGVVLTQSGLLNRPSVTDDGSAIVFIGKDRKIHALLRQNNGSYSESIIQDEAIWRNVCISKDGGRIAALFSQESPTIEVFDFSKQVWNSFELYNPTYTQGVSTGDVLYADAIEFEHSGQYITYDAFSNIKGGSGPDYQYWDIGFLEVWNNNANNWTKGEINKLFSGLPQNISIGNPTLSKNSPYVIAFDLLESNNNSGSYQLWAANIETGTSNQLFDNVELGFPNFSIDDKTLSFNSENQNLKLIASIPLMSNKVEPAGQASILLQGGQLGVWFADGTRNLQVAASNPKEYNDFYSLVSNPVSDELLIKTKMSIANLQFEIFDLNGLLLYRYSAVASENDNIHTINTSSLHPGNYIILIKSEDIISQLPFIKM